MPVMANLAAVFHWELATLDRMPLEELLRWHELAIERSGKES